MHSAWIVGIGIVAALAFLFSLTTSEGDVYEYYNNTYLTQNISNANFTSVGSFFNQSLNTSDSVNFINVNASNITSIGQENSIGAYDGMGNYIRTTFMSFMGSSIAMLEGFSLYNVLPTDVFGMYNGLFLIARDVSDPTLTFYNNDLTENSNLRFDVSEDDLYLENVARIFLFSYNYVVVGNDQSWTYINGIGDLGVGDDLEVKGNSYFHDDMSLEGNDILNIGTISVDNIETGNVETDFLIVNENASVADNLSVGGYYSGQPLDGGLAGGIIWAEEIASSGVLNITLGKCMGAERNCSYPSHIIRIHLQNNTVIYCNMSASDFTVPDDQDSSMLVGKECVVSFGDINDVISGTQTGERVVIGRAMAHGGSIEYISGAEMMPTEVPALRFETFLVDNLKMINGGLIDDSLDDFPNYTMRGGRYIFANTPVLFSQQNSTDDEVELIYHAGGAWASTEMYMGINLTHCDDGTDLVECSDNKIRPYLLFFTGFIQNGDDTTELHQLAALNSLTYPTVAACHEAVLEGEVSFTLPDFYNFGAVKTYVYCARKDDISWDGAWIDLREGGIVSGGGSPDLSPYLTRDGQRTLTADWGMGGFNSTTSGNFSASHVKVSKRVCYNANCSSFVNATCRVWANGAWEGSSC